MNMYIYIYEYVYIYICMCVYCIYCYIQDHSLHIPHEDSGLIHLVVQRPTDDGRPVPRESTSL